MRRLAYPATRGVIVRRVWDDVKQNHVDKFLAEFPDFRPLYANKRITLPNGSDLLFMAAETKADVERKFFGPEYMDVFVDQAEQFSEEELRMMKMACRWPGQPDHACKLGLFFNPGGVSMEFLKRIFYERKYKAIDLPDGTKVHEDPDDYAFIQAYGWDNIEWMRAALAQDGVTDKEFYKWPSEKRFSYFITRSQYGRELNAQPAHIRIGHLLGEFGRFAGQYFGDVWDKDKAVINQQQVRALIKPWWPRWISLDWGFYHYAGVLWHARGKVSAKELLSATGLVAKSAVIDLTVTYKSIMVQQVGEEELANRILAECDEHERRHLKSLFIGPIGPERTVKQGVARTVEQQIGDVMREHKMPAPTIADHDRIGGWRLMYNELKETSDCAMRTMA